VYKRDKAKNIKDAIKIKIKLTKVIEFYKLLENGKKRKGKK